MWYPSKIKLSCKRCGRSPLWIEAFVIGDNEAIPVFVCDSYFGCGAVMEFSEFGIEIGKPFKDGLVV